MDKLKAWLKTTEYKDFQLTIASADASFRKYYRLSKAKEHFLVMDSSLECDAIAPFLAVTKKLQAVGVAVPQIHLQNLDLGYLVIEDFGSTHLLQCLNEENFQQLYKQAIDVIVTMQQADTKGLPLYDRAFFLREMHLMQEWYIEKLLKRSLTQEQQRVLKRTLETICDTLLTQPQNIFVHRDYHSRNIMLREDGELGIIDYQDAMSGALLYDVVSLLKDCYIAFEREDSIELLLYFKEKIGSDVADATFIAWFDFMGMQRHIKVLGIFSRLSLRDGKDGYLKDIPLTLRYTLDALRQYESTRDLALLLEQIS